MSLEAYYDLYALRWVWAFVNKPILMAFYVICYIAFNGFSSLSKITSLKNNMLISSLWNGPLHLLMGLLEKYVYIGVCVCVFPFLSLLKDWCCCKVVLWVIFCQLGDNLFYFKSPTLPTQLSTSLKVNSIVHLFDEQKQVPLW